MPNTDVAIIGAGPYGLSLAAHLRSRGVDHRIFGTPMSAWQKMPAGMYLKSYGFASNIYTPGGDAPLTDYCRARGLEELEPIEIATFYEYGVSVQRDAVPNVEQVDVASVRREGEQFRLTLESGESLLARRVVAAVGLSYFESMPDAFAQLGSDLASHTADHESFDRFAGKRVSVIGAGQSALQAAALLVDAGADVTLIAREEIRWNWRGDPFARRSLIDRIRVPQTVLGPGRDNWVLEHAPMLMHHLPAETRDRFSREHFGPSGAWWLRERVEGRVPTLANTVVVDCARAGDGVSLALRGRDGAETTLRTEHVIAGTGFRVDVDRIGFLAPELKSQVARLDSSPRLSRHFESTVDGLYFVGPASAASFGPLFRFISGAAYTVPVLARHLAWTSHKRSRVVRRSLAYV